MRILLLMLICGPLWAWSDAEEQRYQALIEELRCLVCQNQSIAESNADLAKDLRGQARDMIEAGRSDAEIRTYMTERYGDFVLYRPPLQPRTWALWFGPFLLLLGGFWLLWRLRRPADPVPEAPVSEERLQALLKDSQRND